MVSKVDVWRNFPPAAGLRLVDVMAFLGECEKVGMSASARVVVEHGKISAHHQSVADVVEPANVEHSHVWTGPSKVVQAGETLTFPSVVVMGED